MSRREGLCSVRERVQILTSAGRGGAVRRSAAVAACLLFALTLTACGKNGPEKSATAGPAAAGLLADQGSSAPQAGSPEQSSASSRLSQVMPPSTPLDTSGWLLAPPFYAAGDEPFWRLDIADGWFVFKRSGLPEIEAPMLAPRREHGADIFDTPPLILTVTREPCETSEGGHGDISAVVNFDGSDYGGCAFAGAAGGSAQAVAVLDALPAIDACLAKLGEPALVTGIYAREGNRTGLGLRTRNGAIYECAAEPGGNEIAFLDQIEPRAAKSYMTSQMRFLRDGVSPETKCEGAEDVKSTDKVIGRLLTSKCKF
jgi:uncharacterized membrane protein